MDLYGQVTDLDQPIEPIATKLIFLWLGSFDFLREQSDSQSPIDLVDLIIALARRAATIQLVVNSSVEKGEVTNLLTDKKVFNFSIVLDSQRNIDLYTSLGDCRVQGLQVTDANAPAIEPKKINLEEGDISPRRAASFCGAPYLLAKVIIKRIELELRDRKSEFVKLPPTRQAVQAAAPAFQVEVGGVNFRNGSSIKAWMKRKRPAKDLLLKLNILRFIARAIEYAFFKNELLFVARPNGSVLQVMALREAVDKLRRWTRGEAKIKAPSLSFWKVGYKHKSNTRVRWAYRELGEGLHVRWRVWCRQTEWPSKGLTGSVI